MNFLKNYLIKFESFGTFLYEPINFRELKKKIIAIHKLSWICAKLTKVCEIKVACLHLVHFQTWPLYSFLKGVYRDVKQKKNLGPRLGAIPISPETTFVSCRYRILPVIIY